VAALVRLEPAVLVQVVQVVVVAALVTAAEQALLVKVLPAATAAQDGSHMVAVVVQAKQATPMVQVQAVMDRVHQSRAQQLFTPEEAVQEMLLQARAAAVLANYQMMAAQVHPTLVAVAAEQVVPTDFKAATAVLAL
jgi:hypothetical protein